jgi:hypothetical protein
MSTGYQPKYATYRAVYRLAARPYSLSSAFGAAGRKQYATIHHAATSIYKLQLRAVYVALDNISAAANVVVDLAQISGTLPATGNPAITPRAVDPREPADTDTICLALPTTQGTENYTISQAEWFAGAAFTTGTPISFQNLLDPSNTGYVIDPLVQVPAIRPLTAEGFAVTVDASAAATVNGIVVIEYARISQVGVQG